MLIFLTIYFTVYGGTNLFLFLEVRRAFHPGASLTIVLAAFLALMVAAPVLIRMMEPLGMEAVTRPLAYLAFTWMAVSFWFLVLALARDLWNLAAGRAILPLAWSTVGILAVIAALSLYGLWEAGDLRLEKVEIETSSLKASDPPLKLALIADLHIGLLCREKSVKRILGLIREADPDVLVCAGDLVDGTARCLDSFASLLATLDPPLGKYAVTGNHEFYAGLEESLDFMKRAGFKILRGETAEVRQGVVLIGIDDPAAARIKQRPRGDEDRLLPSGDEKKLVILIKHRPEVAKGSVGRFDLQVSGHTHSGQIYPFNHMVARSFPMLGGLYELGERSRLYTSRGTGTWGPPMRVLSPPEVTLVTIRGG
jgi:predicted MPP superfamily phosphohydrolase